MGGLDVDYEARVQVLEWGKTVESSIWQWLQRGRMVVGSSFSGGCRRVEASSGGCQ